MVENDRVRNLFKDSGLDYSILSYANLEKLRDLINENMVKSGLFNGQYRCDHSICIEPKWAGLTCSSDYFEGREAVSFNRDGFIGFSGWASSKNTKPITDAFEVWVHQMAGNDKEGR